MLAEQLAVLLRSVGFGQQACQMAAWSEVWMHFTKAREAITGVALMPLGDISNAAVLFPCDRGREKPNYLWIAFNVFGALARDPYHNSVIADCDRMMRGALEAQIVSLQRDVAAVERSIMQRTAGDVTATRVVLADMKKDLQALYLLQLLVVWDQSLARVVVDGVAYQVHLDTDIHRKDDVASTKVLTAAPCPGCKDAEWSVDHSIAQGVLACECGHLQPLIPVTQIVPQGVSA
jgi:hypothetical protein